MENNRIIREQLLKSVNELTNQQLNKKVNEEQWSIMQVLDHLYLMESKLVKIMKRTLRDAPSELITDKPIHLTTDRSRKFMSPEYFNPSEQYIPLDEMKQKLQESRNALQQFYEETKNQVLDQKGFPHPIFGQINIKQWISLIGLHEKRHLEQINELKALL